MFGFVLILTGTIIQIIGNLAKFEVPINYPYLYLFLIVLLLIISILLLNKIVNIICKREFKNMGKYYVEFENRKQNIWILKKSNNRFNLIKPFVMVCAEQQSTNHANPSLRSGQALKVKPMLEWPKSSRTGNVIPQWITKKYWEYRKNYKYAEAAKENAKSRSKERVWANNTKR